MKIRFIQFALLSTIFISNSYAMDGEDIYSTNKAIISTHQTFATAPQNIKNNDKETASFAHSVAVAKTINDLPFEIIKLIMSTLNEVHTPMFAYEGTQHKVYPYLRTHRLVAKRWKEAGDNLLKSQAILRMDLSPELLKNRDLLAGLRILEIRQSKQISLNGEWDISSSQQLTNAFSNKKFPHITSFNYNNMPSDIQLEPDLKEEAKTLVNLCKSFPNLLHLDLNCYLGETAGEMVADALPNLTQLKSLGISYTRMGPLAITKIASNLHFLVNLENLVFFENNLEDGGLETITMHLQNLPNLKRLNIREETYGCNHKQFNNTSIENFEKTLQLHPSIIEVSLLRWPDMMGTTEPTTLKNENQQDIHLRKS